MCSNHALTCALTYARNNFGRPVELAASFKKETNRANQPLAEYAKGRMHLQE